MYGFNGNNQYASYPAMQNRLANLEAQYGSQQFNQFNSRPAAPSYLKGRMVASIDEAKASQFDLDGSITFFPCLAENKIYAKTLDNNGLPVFLQFMIQPEQVQQKVQDSNVALVDNLVKRVERLEKELGCYDADGDSTSNAKQ